MQGQRNDLDPYNNAVDYEHGASSDNMDINQSASWSDLNVQPSSHPNLMSYAGANQDVRMFRWQGFGEPFSGSNSNNIVRDNGLKIEQGWPYAFRNAPGCSSRSEDMDFERSRRGFPNTSTVGPNVYSNSRHHPFPPHARSTSMAHCADQSPGCVQSNHKHWQALRENVFSNLLDEYRGPQTDQMSPTDCCHFGSSAGSSSYSVEEMDGSGSSIRSVGHSSKRKLCEGASSQSHLSGNSGSFTQNPNNFNYGGPCNNTLTTTDIPLLPWPQSEGSATQLNQVNPAQSDACLPFYSAEDAEYSLRNFHRIGSVRNPQSFVSFDSSRDENARGSNVHMFEPASQPQSYTGSLGVRSALVRLHSRSPRIESEDMYISLPSRSVHTLRQCESSVYRSGDSSTSINFGPNGNDASLDENYAFRSATEPRNLGQHPSNWSLATGPNSPAMFTSTSRSRAASNSRPLSPPKWIRHQNPPSMIHQRFAEVAPWTLFPSYDAEIRNQSSLSPPLPSLPSSSTPEPMISTRPSSHNEQLAHRRLGPLSEAVNRLSRPSREMAADIEGRHMLFAEIHQVLSGARRGDNLRIEDYMLFDPFIYHGLAEMHDRHRDMRLDVDNMSYEELLALGERIGDVNTGLSEEVIRKSMKQHKYHLLATLTSPDVEPCCVCQEEFRDGEDLGKLDCGHDFHFDCIKQWLRLKNLCPICKTAGLAT